MIIPLKYGDAISKEGAAVALSFTRSEQYLLLVLSENVRENPALYLEDYLDYSSVDINDFLEQLVFSIMNENMSTFYEHRFWNSAPGVITGSALTWVDVANHPHGGVWRQNPAAINDEIKFFMFLTAGDYAMRTKGIIANNRGIQTWSIDPGLTGTFTTIGTHDWYNATTVVDSDKLIATFNVPITGLCALKSKVLSKNASSTDELLTISEFEVWGL